MPEEDRRRGRWQRVVLCPMLLRSALTTRIGTDKSTNQGCNLIRGSIECKVAGLEHVNLRGGHVGAVALRLAGVEGQIILSPDDQQARAPLAHPCLPLRIGVDVGAVVVEQIALDVGLAGLIEESEFVSPEI